MIIIRENTFPNTDSAQSNRKPDVKYCKSRYNILKKYPGEVSILINTASEAVVIMSKDETIIYENIAQIDKISEFINTLARLGLLVRLDENEKSQFDILRNKFVFVNEHVLNLMILPTLDCNARCFYCFQQYKKKMVMTKETADEIVDYIAKTHAKGHEINYRWFGGEPLMECDIIDRIVKGVNKAFNENIKYNSIITTNNSLITDEMIEKYFSVWHVRKINTIIDGYKEEHNRRKAYIDSRLDSYQRSIDNIRKMLDQGYHVVCRIHFDKRNIDQLDDILNDLVEFKDNDRFLIYAIPLKNKCHSEEIARDIYIYPNEDYEGFYARVLGGLFKGGFRKNIQSILPVRARNACLACSINGLIISPDGKFFKCEQQPYDEDHFIGDPKTGIIHNEAYKSWLVFMDKLPAECQDCVYLPCCQGGCHYYRLENKPDASPCLPEKFSINVVFDIIYERFIGRNKNDNY